MKSPRDYDLPHDEWRPHQYETIQWLSEQSGFVLAEASTGSGKTTYPAAMSHDRTVMTLVKTKNLQVTNYQNKYGFDVLFGRGNYPCVHPDVHRETADHCQWAEMGMKHCPVAGECPYLLAKETVQSSDRACLNYAYWLSAQWPRENPPQFLCLDEADELPDLVTEHAGIVLSEKQRKDWDLPEFPRVTGAVSLLTTVNPIGEITDWLTKTRLILRARYVELTRSNNKDMRRRCEDLGMKIGHSLAALMLCQTDWYVRSGPTARRIGDRQVPGLIVKPLTARFHFPTWFNVSPTVLLMSATIGNPVPLAAELGIKEYAFRTVPNIWPAEERQIWAPKDAPKIGGKATPLDYDHQADLAAKAIKECPPDWPGLILVTSKEEALNVAARLARKGLQDRVWVIPERGPDGNMMGTDGQTAAWETRKRKVPGSLMITWSHWRGYDGLDEKTCIVMKTPFPIIGAPGSYENEWMRYGKGLYHWRTANLLAQGTGRTRRGRPEDYGRENGMVAVLDQNWTMVQKHLPKDWLAAVVH